MPAQTKSKYPGDYNPDREGWTGHKYIVQRVWQGADTKSLDVGTGEMKWNKEGRLLVNDNGVANALRQKYKADITVTRMKWPDAHDRGHKYIFGGWPEMPWKRKVQDGNAEEIQENAHEETGYAQDARWAHDVGRGDGEDDGKENAQGQA